MPDEEIPDQGLDSQDTVSGMYEPYLSQFPEEVRETAEAAFKEWDANVTKKFQEYEPYKEFTSYDPQIINAGLNLIGKIAENPREVYDIMAQTYGFEEAGQGQEAESANPVQPNEETSNPTDYEQFYNQMQQQLNELREQVSAQQSAKEEELAMQEFQGMLGELREQYGDYDEDYVLAKIAAGIEPEEAVKGYMAFYENIAGQPAKPNYPVLGGSGGVPSNELDFNKMDSKETKDIIAQLLMRANEG